MYHKIIHTSGDLTALKEELAAFRAKITARKIRELGITDLQLTEVLDKSSYVSMEAKGL